MHLSCSPSLARRVVHGTKVQGPPQARKAKGKGHQPMHHQPICMHQPTKSARVPACSALCAAGRTYARYSYDTAVHLLE